MRYDSGIRAGRIWQDGCPEAAMGGGNQGERQEEFEGRCKKAAVSSTHGKGRRFDLDLHQEMSKAYHYLKKQV